MSLRVIFAGTPAFAVPPLTALLGSRHHVELVLTQPDRPGGRGMHLRPSPVKVAAAAAGIPVYQPATLKDPRAIEQIREVGADIMVVVAYGLILPQAVLDLPRLGALNIHASLLPRWRGAAPIHRAVLAGDVETGVCIMRMEAGLDTGPVLLSERTAIGPRDTTGTLHDRLADRGARLLLSALDLVESGRSHYTVQGEVGVTYAQKIDKAEAAIDWRRAADAIDRQVRAFDPAPGAAAVLRGVPVKVWAARPEAGVSPDAEPGTVLSADASGIVVACGTGALRLLELQRAGGKRLPAVEFLRGVPLAEGDRFDPAT